MQRTPHDFHVCALRSLAGVAGVPEGFNVQLMPWGEFAAMDGRPQNVGLKAWTFDQSNAADLVDRFNARKTPMVIDYEHQTINAEQNGKPAPAAGWIEKLAAVAGLGLVAQVKWTAKAQAAIAADEYRYVSPVFSFDRKTGAVHALKHAGLVNDPGLSATAQSVALKFAADGGDDDSQTNQPNGVRGMDLLTSLRTALGFTADATPESCLTAVTSLKAKANEVDAKVGEIASLKAKQFDPAKHVDIDTHKAVTTELAALKADKVKTERGALIEAALKDGKLVPAQKAWAETLDVATLSAFLKDAPTVAPGSTQSKGASSGGGDAEQAPEEIALKARKYIADQKALGITVSAAQAVDAVTKKG